ncbi:MAG TPA: hypothetical protein VGH40_20480 [Roseiarcus sp.]|jgi:hypothetical protein
MVDETSPKSEPEIVSPTPGPLPSREPRHDPGVIDGEATEIHASQPAPPETDEVTPDAEEPAADPAPERPPSAARPFLAALAGALIGGAAAFTAVWFLDPRAGEFEPVMARLAALEHQADADKEGAAALDKRLRALEANEAATAKASTLDALAKRVAGLESAAGKNEAAQTALSEARAARADAAKALALAGQAGARPAPQDGQPSASQANALEARLAKLESEISALEPAAADLGPIKDRLSRVEAALAAPKSETRVSPSEDAAGGGATAAVLATSLVDRLDAGAPYAQELAALTRLGADGAKLAALKPYAESGAPTLASLRADFLKRAPAVAAAATPPEEGGVMDRLIDHMRKLVRVHNVGEPATNDPEALTSRIAAALARGDLAAALEAYRRLPEPAQRAAADWAKSAEARQGAGEAALALRADAVSRLAAAKH